ncbi:hypothetical protein ACSSS7_003617 [Eimeria intestinalis]
MVRPILLLLLLLLLLLPASSFARLVPGACLQQRQQQQVSTQQQQRFEHVFCSRSSSSSSSSNGRGNDKGLLTFIRCSQPSAPTAAKTAAAAAAAAATAAGRGARPPTATSCARSQPPLFAAPPAAAAAATATGSTEPAGPAGAAAAAGAPPAAPAAAARSSPAAAAAAAAAAGGELGQCVRPLFPLLSPRKKFVPFDNAATTHKPRSVINAEAGVYRHLNANIHRGAYRLAAAATEAVEGFGEQNVREKLARFVGGEPEEIVFTGGTTAAINMVARAWGDAFVEEGSEVVVSVAEHHANLVPWQQLAKRKNAKLRFIPLHKSSRELDIKGAMAQLSSRTRVLAVACVSNVLGAFVKQQQLQQLLRFAKSQHQNLVTLVDATQAVQHTQINARELGADFLVASGHKMYGSTGVGFLWGRKEVLQRMPPDNLGGEMIQRVQLASSTFASSPWRFEAGTLPIAQIAGLGAAVDFLQDVGLSNIAAADARLSRLLLEAVNDLPRVRILSVHPQQQQQQHHASAAAAAAAETTIPICSFVIEGLSPFDLAVCADQWHNIHLRAGIAAAAGAAAAAVPAAVFSAAAAVGLTLRYCAVAAAAVAAAAVAVAAAAGHHCAQPLHEEILKVPGSVRASLAVYNTQDEVYRFHDAMIKTIKRLDSVIAKSLKPRTTTTAAARDAKAASKKQQQQQQQQQQQEKGQRSSEA